MIDLGLTDEDLKTPPTKTGHQYQKALDKKAREILDKIEVNFKGDLKESGNMPYTAIRQIIYTNVSMNGNILKRYKPWMKYNKFEKGGEVDENVAKIRFNDHFKKVQLFIDGSLYGEFDTYQDAIEDAKNNNSEVIVEDDVTMLNISTKNPLSNQLSKITGDGWNSIDYQNLSGGIEVTTNRPFKHIASGKIFEVVKK